MLRPALTIVYRGANGREQRADALSITVVTRDGKYVIAYVSSGTMLFLTMDRIINIELSTAFFCPWCDQNIEKQRPCNEVDGEKVLGTVTVDLKTGDVVHTEIDDAEVKAKDIEVRVPLNTRSPDIVECEQVCDKGANTSNVPIKQPNTEAPSKPEREPQADNDENEYKDAGDAGGVLGVDLLTDDDGCEDYEEDGKPHKNYIKVPCPVCGKKETDGVGSGPTHSDYVCDCGHKFQVKDGR